MSTKNVHILWIFNKITKIVNLIYNIKYNYVVTKYILYYSTYIGDVWIMIASLGW